MPRLALDKLPKYGLHKPSGQAIVVLNGKTTYLGTYESPASKSKYERAVAEWQARGRQPRVDADSDDAPMDVEVLLGHYIEYAKKYYVKNGKPTSEFAAIKSAIRPMLELYADIPAVEFGPKCLKAVREKMIEAGWTMKSINKQITRIRGVFSWALSEELEKMPAAVLVGLKTVKGLKPGRSAAKPTEKIKPVPIEYVAAALRFLSPTVRAMVELQLVTGMRPGEVCMIRGPDIDTTGNLWLYRPSSHKTEHHEQTRDIYLGPRAQEILRDHVRMDVEAFLFSPADSAAWLLSQRRAKRKTPLHYGN